VASRPTRSLPPPLRAFAARAGAAGHVPIMSVRSRMTFRHGVAAEKRAHHPAARPAPAWRRAVCPESSNSYGTVW